MHVPKLRGSKAPYTDASCSQQMLQAWATNSPSQSRIVLEPMRMLCGGEIMAEDTHVCHYPMSHLAQTSVLRCKDWLNSCVYTRVPKTWDRCPLVCRAPSCRPHSMARAFQSSSSYKGTNLILGALPSLPCLIASVSVTSR